MTKDILENTDEDTQKYISQGQAFQRAIRTSGELQKVFGERPPGVVPERGARELPAYRISAAILSELSGKRLVIYDHGDSAAHGGVTVPELPESVFVDAHCNDPTRLSGHEAWHRLYIDHRNDAAIIGARTSELADPWAL